MGNDANISADDVRWMEIILRQVDGLAALAEAQAESCNREWMSMQYSLETIAEMLKENINNMKERIEI